ncbi:hypothetical protein P6F26_09435 [Roseibacterium sp. SDUM158017]|uniref:hypothetical protein n=1 Tax=Roseicyclus salinarum TaxID=3036773 RepID=UPI0024157CC1|nr:hypothetical protein [Roseibacterium sp. SDUM158017]MDG4648669.1 hypothetical protein [Roseibacterium sp. SDUM158017]
MTTIASVLAARQKLEPVETRIDKPVQDVKACRRTRRFRHCQPGDLLEYETEGGGQG